MKNISLLALVTLFFIVASCSDETIVYQEQLNDNLTIENNQANLDASVSFKNANILDVITENENTGKTSTLPYLSGEYPLSLVAQIEMNKEGLTATHVAVEDNFVFTSYNTVGETFSGAIDAIDISNPLIPILKGRLFLETADINSLAYDNGYVYAVGSFDSEKDITIEFNSLIAKIPVANGVFDKENIVYGYQEGFNSTDVKIIGDLVIVASGGEGLLKAYNKNSLEAVNDIPFDDLRSIAIKDDEISVLNASSGIKILNKSFDILNEINISSDFGDFAKRTIDYSDTQLLVSEGVNGAGVYDPNSGSFIKHLPIPIRPDGVQSQNIVTNAVAYNEDLLLMANGGAGLSIAKNKNGNLETLGIIDIEGSINYVGSKGDYVFAASGTEGMQIIKLNKPNADLNQACGELSNYQDGYTDLNVSTGQDLGYNVGQYFRSIENSGSLLLCGWFVSNTNLLVKENSLLETNGRFWVRNDLVIDGGAKLRVKGTYIIIYGDLILNDGATLEFVDNNVGVYVLGEVIRNGETLVEGSYIDHFNRF